MNGFASDERQPDFRVGQELCDDNGDTIGTRAQVVEDGLPASATDRLEEAFRVLTPRETAQLLANRVVIERAKGMLIFIYGIDADAAFELLKCRSQITNVKLRLIAERLVSDLVALDRTERLDVRTVGDGFLLNLPERLGR